MMKKFYHVVFASFVTLSAGCASVAHVEEKKPDEVELRPAVRNCIEKDCNDAGALAFIEKGKKFVSEKVGKGTTTSRHVFVNTGKDGVAMVCGEVATGVSLGKEESFERFIARGSTNAVVLESEVVGFQSTWDRFCTQ